MFEVDFYSPVVLISVFVLVVIVFVLIIVLLGINGYLQQMLFVLGGQVGGSVSIDAVRVTALAPGRPRDIWREGGIRWRVAFWFNDSGSLVQLGGGRLGFSGEAITEEPHGDNGALRMSVALATTGIAWWVIGRLRGWKRERKRPSGVDEADTRLHQCDGSGDGGNGDEGAGWVGPIGLTQPQGWPRTTGTNICTAHPPFWTLDPHNTFMQGQ